MAHSPAAAVQTMHGSDAPVRIGVVGCGEIAQLVHLPLLHELPEFELAAVCDVSPRVVDHIGERWGVRRRHLDYRELVAGGGLDALAVLTMEHVGPALAGADAGLHLFVEKPLAYTPEDATAIVAAARCARRTLMVGYVRQFDPAYELARELVHAMPGIRLTRVHDFAGDFELHRPLRTAVRRSDLPADWSAASRGAIDEKLRLAADGAAELYGDMLMLASHDVALLRGLLGEPSEIRFACRTGEAGLLAVLDHRERGTCVFEADCLASLPGWDQQLVVHGDAEDVDVRFAHPYVQQPPSLVRVRERAGAASRVSTTPVSYMNPFRREWLHFAECVHEGVPARTSGADAAADVELIKALVCCAGPSVAPVDD